MGGRECGTILSDNAKFCPECGTAATAVLTVSCPCGVTLRGEHKFCHNCGKLVQLNKLPESTPKVCSAKLSDGTTCGFTLLQGLSFCPQCGVRYSSREDQQEPAAEKEACSARLPDGTACGFLLTQDLTCCPKCGVKIPTKKDKETFPGGPAAVDAKQQDADASDTGAALPSAAEVKQSDATEEPGTPKGDDKFIVVVNHFYISLFSALKQPYYTLVTCDSRCVTVHSFVYRILNIYSILTKVVYMFTMLFG